MLLLQIRSTNSMPTLTLVWFETTDSANMDHSRNSVSNGDAAILYYTDKCALCLFVRLAKGSGTA